MLSREQTFNEMVKSIKPGLVVQWFSALESIRPEPNSQQIDGTDVYYSKLEVDVYTPGSIGGKKRYHLFKFLTERKGGFDTLGYDFRRATRKSKPVINEMEKEDND